MSATPPPHRAAIDGVRGLAALGVLAYHVWLYREDRPHGRRGALIDHVLFSANLGLIAFFVLSGFLLYRAYARAALTRTAPPGAVDYARRRPDLQRVRLAAGGVRQPARRAGRDDPGQAG
jgi:peptidoglycan/LPS O-acetylase OafA/YrhL